MEVPWPRFVAAAAGMTVGLLLGGQRMFGPFRLLRLDTVVLVAAVGVLLSMWWASVCIEAIRLSPPEGGWDRLGRVAVWAKVMAASLLLSVATYGEPGNTRWALE